MRHPKPLSRKPSPPAPAVEAAARRKSLDALFRPVDVASLAAFRIGFGALMFWEVTRYVLNGWVRATYIDPPFHFTYYGFSWVRPWSGAGMYAHFFALGLLSALVMLGLRYRAATALLCAGWSYVFLLEKAEYLNHLYLFCLVALLMTFVPAHRALSLDAVRRPDLRGDSVPAWALWLLRIQFAIPYFYGGLSKLNGDWLRGQPMEIWMGRMEHLREILPAYGSAWLALAASWGGLLLDLLVVPLLLWRRTRPWAFAAGVAFHLMNAAMFRIGVFPWMMIVGTTLFLPPDWPRRVFRLPSAERPRPIEPRHPRLTAALLVGWIGVQLLLPFRHLLYPGDVNWTEEGGRFAWRMMLTDRTPAIQVLVQDSQTGRLSAVDPGRYLTPRQLEKMGQYPDMMLEFVHHLSDERRRAGFPRAEIHVINLVALNGRRPQLLIDPAADLAAQPRSLAPKPWIVPLHEPLPDEPWLVPPPRWREHLDLSRWMEWAEHGKR